MVKCVDIGMLLGKRVVRLDIRDNSKWLSVLILGCCWGSVLLGWI